MYWSFYINEQKGVYMLNLSNQDVKAIVESEGLDFNQFKQDCTNELQLDFLNKGKIFKEFEKEYQVQKALEILLKKVSRKKGKQNDVTKDVSYQQQDSGNQLNK